MSAMERYTEIRSIVVEDEPDAHTVWLKVGNQSFKVGDYLDTKEEADWFRDMLHRALETIVSDAKALN